MCCSVTLSPTSYTLQLAPCRSVSFNPCSSSVFYTDDYRSTQPSCHIVKFADYSVLLFLLSGPSHHHSCARHDFVEWCDNSFLELNMKIKEMVETTCRAQSLLQNYWTPCQSPLHPMQAANSWQEPTGPITHPVPHVWLAPLRTLVFLPMLWDIEEVDDFLHTAVQLLKCQSSTMLCSAC